MSVVPPPVPGYGPPPPASAPPPGTSRSSGKVLWIVLGVVAALVLCCGGAVAVSIPLIRQRLSAAAPSVTQTSAPTATTATTCVYSADATGERSAPTPPAKPRYSGKPTARLTTNRGVIVITLDADRAPCTVNSFANLITSGFLANSPCHRLTTAGIFVLQCGDPTGTGTGGPGYRYEDENLPVGKHPAYPRASVAMANAGPATNGSQFFLVYRDSDIDPDYTVFGTVTAGLNILDAVAAAGSDDGNGSGDGKPRTAIQITSATVS